ELGRDRERCPIADWHDAFVPVPMVGVTEVGSDGGWWTWKGALPKTDGLPGDALENGQRWSVADYATRSVELLLNLLRTTSMQDEPRSASGTETESGNGAERTPSEVADGMSQLLRYGAMATLAGLIQAVELLKLAVGSLALLSENVILRFLDAIRVNASSLLEARLEQDAALRSVWQVIDLTPPTLLGRVRFCLITDPRGLLPL